MTIIVFLIDTSASMNQRAYLGGRPTLLDVAKSAVETFVKVRQRSPESRGDRYMLLTFEDPPQNIKAGWKENLATFMNELKNLQCIGLTTLGAALKHALDVLNINRMQTGIDTYGQGRCPFYLEPSVIVVITDGGKYTTVNGVHQDFTLPMHSPIPGSELTKEPFRWDQRLFSLVLRLSGTPAVERDIGLVASDASPIDAMCEVTGGRSYCITSFRMMIQCIDSLVQKVQSGVVINFEKIGPDPPPLVLEGQQTAAQHQEEEENEEDGNATNGLRAQYPNVPVPAVAPAPALASAPTPVSTSTVAPVPISTPIQGQVPVQAQAPTQAPANTAWHSCRRLIYVPRSAQKGFAVGFWPIPESFWPDLSASSLPPRSAHPNVKFTCTSQEPMVIENLPFDKYELEPSPLTQYILARKQPTTCWQVFVANSYKSSEVGHPFGYLKASTNLTCVNLFVMPYNYPVLLPLLEELFKVHRQKPTPEWRAQFQSYIRTMPTYYAASLRRALTRMGASAPLAQTLIPDNMDNSLSYSVLNYLKRLKNQAKIEFDRLCNEVISKQVAASNLTKNLTNCTTSVVTEGVRVIPKTPLKKDLVSHPLLQDKFTGLRDQLNEFGGFVVGIVKNQQQQRGAHSYRNAFDVPRKSLLDQVVRMRANFLQPGLLHTKLLDDDYVHSMPLAQMGNYQEYLKRMTPPLREIESVPVRQHMFGNPFKIDKRMMVDEADIDMVGATSSTSKGGLKRTLPQSDSVGSSSPRPPPNKRKPGPIPKDVIVRRPSYSPTNTPPSSPIPWVIEETKSQVTGTTAAATAAATTITPTPIADMSTPPVLCLSNVSHVSLPCSSVSEKLVNGLAEMPIIPVFEPIPVEHVNNHMDTPPVLTPIINNVDAISKSDVKSERTDNARNECSRLPPINDCIENNVRVVDNSATEEKLTNHVEEKREPKTEKERKLTKKELEDIRRHNLSIRTLVYKEVRRRGKNYATLFSHLHQVQGTLDIRLAFVQDIVKESLRFKRHNLASLLEEYLKTIQEDSCTINHKLNHNGATKISY
ncbi:integrator complex subunit 6 isoform X2 [Monomorium pharaonis]|uniref:integrator complex subunit 6 isoform X2 n=1 Tax=Monomorium pharaonis TaxID=307658 RepID=UPI001746C080|nr:integrator complex subunit 6 isoform X2 [Monomorium pharaonis]